ncbi:MAG: RlmE family RNA methyltransferase [Rickettsiales bacterium]|jgi:23S rRNA (uridine2552-2'-O)-methyltransferase|nr:RlmE family RNA methyltransferase [Rickettsiales bacterium]
MKISSKKISSKKSSAAWLRRQLSDPYVERAKREGWRSRAVYKLSEINDKLHILHNGQTVVDLGSAPGSWSQYIKKTFPDSHVMAIDLLPMKPIDGVKFFQGDFTTDETLEWLNEKTYGRDIDIVLSDMAPNTTGHQKTDHIRQIALIEYAFDFAKNNLKRGGAFVAKSFVGGTTDKLLHEIKRHFREVRHIKPKSSRKESVEMFIIAIDFLGKQLL